MPGERAAALAAESILQRACEVLRVARSGRKQRIGLPGQQIDVERLDQIGDRRARRRLAAEDQRVSSGIGQDAGGASRERLQHFRQLLGARVAQRQHDAAAGCVNPRAAPAGGGRCAGSGGRNGGGRDHLVDAARLHEGGVVLREQRLQRRHELRVREWGCRMQRRGAVHGRVDRIVDVQNAPEYLGHDLADVGVREIQRHRPALRQSAGRRGRQWLRLAVAELGRRRQIRGSDDAVDARGRFRRIVPRQRLEGFQHGFGPLTGRKAK